MAQVTVYDQQQLLREVDPDNRLERYYHLLAEENARINLVSRETLPDSGELSVRFAGLGRLAAESLYPMTQVNLKLVRNYLDIGSGGGFPSIPIMLTQNPAKAVLVERTQKKAAALGRLIAALGCSARVDARTFEELTLPAESFDLITLRLVRLDQGLFKKVVRLLHSDGAFVYYSETSIPIDPVQYTVTRLRYSGSSAGDIHTATVIRRNH